MQRARMISNPLPKGTKTTIRRREWGMERTYITTRGNEIYTGALYEDQLNINRKLKILASVLISLKEIG